MGALVAASFALRAWVARDVRAPTVMVDELVYSELARSFASAGRFLVRDLPSDGYGVLYPLLISPAFAAFDDLPSAYAAVKAVNALAMSTAAVPAYLLARRVLEPGWAVAAAALAVAVPSLAYTSTVMTENVFYPLFVLASWALVRALEEPRLATAATVWLTVAVAFAARPHALALVPAVLTAPLLLALLERSGRRGLARHAPLYAVGALAALAAAVAAAALRGSPLALLGAYDVVAERAYDVPAVLRFWLWHAGELTLYVGVAPVAALLVLTGLARRQPPAVQALLAATIAIVLWLTLLVAAFASRFADRIQERNVFLAAPLLLVALLVWSSRPQRPPRLTAAALGAAVALPLLVPYDRFAEGLTADTLALLALASSPLPELATVALGAAAAAALVGLVPARAAPVVPLLVAAWFATVGYLALYGARGLSRTADAAVAAGVGTAPRDWIDRAVPAGEPVAAIWSGRTHPLTVHLSEFFNRRVGRVYRTAAPLPGGLPETPLTVAGDGAVRAAGPPLRERYLLVDEGGTITPRGTVVARAPGAGIHLVRVDPPLVTLTRVEGLYAGDTWSGPRVTYVRDACAGGTLTVSLASDPALFTQTVRVVAASGAERRSVRFAPADTASLRIPLAARSGRCTVRFTVSPTAVPSETVPGKTDSRLLGAHFRGFVVGP